MNKKLPYAEEFYTFQRKKDYHYSEMWTFFLIKAFQTELKSCYMQCYSMIQWMRIYKIVCCGMRFQWYGIRFQCYARDFNSTLLCILYRICLNSVYDNVNRCTLLLVISFNCFVTELQLEEVLSLQYTNTDMHAT